MIRALALAAALLAPAAAYSQPLDLTYHGGAEASQEAVIEPAPWVDPDAWQPHQWAMLGIAAALQVVDLGQTLWISSHNCDSQWGQTTQEARCYHEANPLNGRRAKPARVLANMALSSAVLVIGAHYLPGWRDTILYYWIGSEALLIEHNKQIGIGLRY